MLENSGEQNSKRTLVSKNNVRRTVAKIVRFKRVKCSLCEALVSSDNHNDKTSVQVRLRIQCDNDHESSRPFKEARYSIQ
jgi:hypothetical protein